MDRFSLGSKEQYHCLDMQLNDGLCHIFPDCKLPAFCTPSTTRMGFEKKSDNKYIVFIDYGVTADCNDDSFKNFLSSGEKEFTSIDKVQEFFISFSRYFSNETLNSEGNTTDLFDEKELLNLCEKSNKHKIIRSANISNNLKKQIFGQDAAIELLSSKIAAHINSNTQKPLALILAGPSGVGKTHTGKCITKVISQETGKQYGFISDSLNTIKTEHAICKYLGAPPSYTGYGDKTVFDPVTQNPYHIILMNELDKAHNNLLEVLMEALDTGIFHLTSGKQIDMSHCIFIFTSNMKIDYAKYFSYDSAFERTTLCRDTLAESGIHNSIPRRIDEFIIYTELDAIASATIIAGYIKAALMPYETELVKIDESLMSSILTLKNKYGGDTLSRYVTSLITDKIEADDMYEEIRGKKLILNGTVKNIEIETRKGD